MFWDLKLRQRPREGGAYTFYCWKKLCCARLSISAQMLESGYSPKTGYWLETRIWLGFDAAGNSTLKGMHKSTYSSFSALSRSCSPSCLETGGKLPPILLHDGNCLENLGKNSGSSGWPDTGKGQDDWDSTFHNKIFTFHNYVLFFLLEGYFFFKYWRPVSFRRSCGRKVYNIMVLGNCLIAAISNLPILKI